MITVEVIEPTKRVRLKTGDNSPYIGKRKLAAEIGKSPTTLAKWEYLLIRYVPDFRKYFKPRKAWNYYQAWCLELVSDYWEKLPDSAPADAISDYIQQNTHLFTEENYFNELATTIKREQAVNSSRVIEAA